MSKFMVIMKAIGASFFTLAALHLQQKSHRKEQAQESLSKKSGMTPSKLHLTGLQKHAAGVHLSKKEKATPSAF